MGNSVQTSGDTHSYTRPGHIVAYLLGFLTILTVLAFCARRFKGNSRVSVAPPKQATPQSVGSSSTDDGDSGDVSSNKIMGEDSAVEFSMNSLTSKEFSALQLVRPAPITSSNPFSQYRSSSLSSNSNPNRVATLKRHEALRNDGVEEAVADSPENQEKKYHIPLIGGPLATSIPCRSSNP